MFSEKSGFPKQQLAAHLSERQSYLKGCMFPIGLMFLCVIL